MKKKNIVSHTAFLGLLACVIAIGLAMAGSAGIFGGSAGRIFAADINWSVDGDGTVRDSSGKAIKGTKIQLDHKNPALQSAAVTSKKNAAKTVIAEAVRSGLIQDPGVSPDDMTLEEILAIPTFQQLDFDRDGITNAEEIRLGTDPYVADTDRDGQSDGVEIQSGHDPKIFSPGDSRDTVVREDVKSPPNISYPTKEKGARKERAPSKSVFRENLAAPIIRIANHPVNSLFAAARAFLFPG
jgi:hypothetical protein